MTPERMLLAAVAALAGTGACAQTVADQINTMKAQVELINQQGELNRALARTAGTDLGTLPRVVAVYGLENKLQARLLLASGMVATFEEGDTIRGNMRVTAVTPRSVLVSVSNGKKQASFPLDFVSATANATPMAGMAGLPGQPGMAPGAPASPLPPELLPPPPALGMPFAAPSKAANNAAANGATGAATNAATSSAPSAPASGATAPAVPAAPQTAAAGGLTAPAAAAAPSRTR